MLRAVRRVHHRCVPAGGDGARPRLARLHVHDDHAQARKPQASTADGADTAPHSARLVLIFALLQGLDPRRCPRPEGVVLEGPPKARKVDLTAMLRPS